MLVKCPDCRRELSRDMHVCPSCGCNFDLRDDSEFEVVIRKDWSVLGIISLCMTVPRWFITIVAFTMASTLMMFSKSSEGAYVFKLWLGLCILPITQIVLGAKSLYKFNCYKWPGILGVVLGSISIIIWTIFSIALYFEI